MKNVVDFFAARRRLRPYEPALVRPRSAPLPRTWRAPEPTLTLDEVKQHLDKLYEIFDQAGKDRT